MIVSTLAVLGLARATSAATYNLLSSATGQSFIDSFYFVGGWNETIGAPAWNWWNSGDDFLVNVTSAKQLGMLAIEDNGNVKIGVDTRPKIDYNQKRNSFRLESRLKYGFGTVWVLDATHLPFGCAMWPAYWTTADNWPNGGEIDILENVNKRNFNQAIFHTGGACKLAAPEGTMTGQVVLDNCQHFPDNNAGCGVIDNRPTSFGEGFNNNGGGVWVTEFSSTAINLWFFPRPEVPAALTDLSAATIDTSTLGKPVSALLTNAGCNIAEEFDEQKVIINTSLCGNFAGETDILNGSGCPVVGTETCYNTYVTGATQPADFVQAYFSIASFRVFQAAGSVVLASTPDGPAETPASNPPGSGTNTGAPSGTTTKGAPTSSTTPDGAVAVAASRLAVALAVVGAGAALAMF